LIEDAGDIMNNGLHIGDKIGESGAAMSDKLIADKVTNLDTRPKADHLES
jgi:hypothetical protein